MVEKKKIKKIGDSQMEDMEGNFLEHLSIDIVIIKKLNEVIEKVNELDGRLQKTRQTE